MREDFLTDFASSLETEVLLASGAVFSSSLVDLLQVVVGGVEISITSGSLNLSAVSVSTPDLGDPMSLDRAVIFLTTFPSSFSALVS